MSGATYRTGKGKATLFSALFVCICLLSASILHAQTPMPKGPHPDTDNEDHSRLAIFLQPGISFLGFDDRALFQAAIDTIYDDFKEQALTESESLYVAKQDFQKVNFCFPVSLGLQWQWINDNFISLGAGYFYDNESVVLTDRKDKIHNYSYTLQGFPLFLEYRVAIPPNFLSLSGESLFSVSARWYWMLPGTEIYSSWGHIEAKQQPWGNGFGISIGYLITSWKNIHIFGDIGYTSITVKSDESFSKVVPTGSTGKASWDVGGIQMQFRFSFGVLKMPEKGTADAPPSEHTAEPPTP